MTPEQQRIAIAEACGWKIGPPLITPGGYMVSAHYSESWRLPNYLNDLNAMHEAEKVLTLQQQKQYSEWVDAVIDSLSDFQSYHATAPQRAEAFLRTLNLWK